MADPRQHKDWVQYKGNPNYGGGGGGGGGNQDVAGASKTGASLSLPSCIDTRESAVYTIGPANLTGIEAVDKVVKDLFKEFNALAELRRAILRTMHARNITRKSFMPEDVHKDVLTAVKMGKEAKGSYAIAVSKGGRPGKFPDILAAPIAAPKQWSG